MLGFWVNREFPTGSKDPFALRRAALGVIRTVQENSLRLRLIPHLGMAFARSANAATKQLTLNINNEIWETSEQLVADEGLEAGSEYLSAQINEATSDVEERAEEIGTNIADGLVGMLTNLLSFFHDRLKVYLRDQGIRHDIIDACIAMPNNDDLTLLVKRATALSEFLKTDDGENLLQGFKRANNILTQAEENDGVEYSYGADVKFAQTDEEKNLFAALSDQGGAISSAIESEDFAAAMQGMAALRTPIDAFFENVQVNDDSAIIRRNRLNLLGDIRKLCLSVADLTRVEG